jgi:hypothetical protein
MRGMNNVKFVFFVFRNDKKAINSISIDQWRTGPTFMCTYDTSTHITLIHYYSCHVILKQCYFFVTDTIRQERNTQGNELRFYEHDCLFIMKSVRTLSKIKTIRPSVSQLFLGKRKRPDIAKQADVIFGTTCVPQTSS